MTDAIGQRLTAVIVTRGDVDLCQCLAAIDADEIKIVRGHGGVWERYEAALTAKHPVVYTQDDDCVVDFAAVVREYEPGRVVCNMPEWKQREYGDGIALVGWGAIFDRDLVGPAFARYFSRFEKDDLFRREADRVFTGLSKVKMIDAPFELMEYASDAHRLGAQPDHMAKLAAIRERVAAVRVE